MFVLLYSLLVIYLHIIYTKRWYLFQFIESATQITFSMKYSVQTDWNL